MHVIVRAAEYTDADIRARFFEMMNALGGDQIRPGSRVLIKPNLLSPAKPSHALLTHPLIVKAAVEYVLARKAYPIVSDSPAMGSFDKILRDGGIKEALNGLDVPCRPFESSVPVDIGPPFGAIDLAQEAIEADAIINLPKLKTHSQMLLTLGVKNLFGCVVGYRKPEWHMRAGVDRAMFARLLVLIARRIRPAYTILDGILAMEGEGPGKSGVPRKIGVLMGSTDPIALDLAVCRMLKLHPAAVPTLHVAGEMGLLSENLTIDGGWPAVDGFVFPSLENLVFGPDSWQRFTRLYLLQRPAPNMVRCKLCGECITICPAKAIEKTGQTLDFRYDKCIRCYCCQEVCPHGAIGKKDNRVARTIRAVAEKLL